MEDYSYQGVPGQVYSRNDFQSHESQGFQPGKPAAIDQTFDSEIPNVTQAPHGQISSHSAHYGFSNHLAQVPAYRTGTAPAIADAPQQLIANVAGGLNSGLTFNGHTLHASARPTPEEFLRIPSGESVVEPGSILDEESGRTYHNHHTGKYFLPNDAAEQDRLDLQHLVFKIYQHGALYRAPVSRLANVLDVGTGTGIWAIQFAIQHPESNVIGTDLSLIQPWNAPDNCSFIKENSEYDEWLFPDPFDFVFLRLVVSCFDYHFTVFKKGYDSLNPGGWIEIHDATFELLCTDGSCTGSSIERWCRLMLSTGEVVGRDFLTPKKYKQWLIDAGFVDVFEDVGPLPGNPWPADPHYRELGRWQMANFYRGVRGMSWKLLRALGMPPEEIEDLIEGVKRDLLNTNLHFCFPVYTLYGRKPFVGEFVRSQDSSSY